MKNLSEYKSVRDGIGYFEQKRGLIKVSGAEAVMFLNGLITNDVKKLEENKWMLAAFPNAQGRTLAVVRVLRFGGDFLFETEAATYEKVLKNLERFTFAGDFKVEDLTDEFVCFSVRGGEIPNFKFQTPSSPNQIAETLFGDGKIMIVQVIRGKGFDIFVPKISKESFENELKTIGAIEIGEDVREILRIEYGLPLYDVEMDETTIVPEINLPELVSYNKGCYIGQEIIARIHFRGHVAKQLTGLVFDDENAEVKPNDELKSSEEKNAGRITSVTFSPKLGKTIALAFVRYDYLKEGTQLKVNDFNAQVKNLPFVEST
ncbi:MAG: glycine cleavage T C-terminal barrel domain-containing protein [Acidobacteriota bacterium]